MLCDLLVSFANVEQGIKDLSDLCTETLFFLTAERATITIHFTCSRVLFFLNGMGSNTLEASLNKVVVQSYS
jgi:hypothetical protein